MFLRVARAALVFLPCSATALPSSDPAHSVRVLPVPGTVRDAGVYHLATGTWTRKAASAQLGADIIYNNSCSTGYYSPLSGDAYVDEGRIPSPTSPNNLTSKPGLQFGYTVDGFEIGYCTDQSGGPGVMTYTFFETYVGCTSVIGFTPTAAFAVSGLPGAGTTGLCWLITLDLASPPQTASLAFAMLADGDGAYSNGTGDLFGWSQESNLPDANQLATGPLIQGNFNLCTGWDGTRWDPVVNYAEQGTGMSTENFFYIENGPTTPGCYFFGLTFPGQSSFHLLLFSGVCGIPGGPGPGTVFCPGDCSGTPAPCGNCSLIQPPGDPVGALNSLNVGGRLRGTGGSSPCTYPPLGPTCSISSDDVVLVGSQMPNSSALYFQGTTRINGGAGSQFGDGLRCAGGTVIRLGTKTNVGGGSVYPALGDQPISVQGGVTTPGTRTYQVWYRNAAVFCTAATFNLTNGYELVWGA